MSSHKLTHKISTAALVMLITGSIDNIRNLPATALFGTTLIFFFIFSALVFLIPAALISAELSSTWTQEGGIYHWTRLALGKKIGFLAIWLQWINTMVWYPTILSFIAATIAYLLDPALANNKYYLIAVILVTFWTLTIINQRGLSISTKITSFCTTVGMLIPMVLIIGIALIWILSGKPLQIQFTSHDIWPSLGHGQNWISLTAIMTAFLGMELATVHVNDIENPQGVFPKAMFYSVIIILFTMILGSLAIAMIIPPDTIGLVTGVMQVFDDFFTAYHLGFITPIVIIMLLIGSFGGIINWIISPAKGLMHAADQGFLPTWFASKNKHKVPHIILYTQAILVSLICLVFLLMPSVNGSYWLLTDLSTQLYMFMYVLMFIAAIVLRYKYPDKIRHFKILGGRFGIWLTGLLGLLGCAITITVGFFPPGGIDVGSPLHYLLVFSGGLIVMTLPILGFYWYHRRHD